MTDSKGSIAMVFATGDSCSVVDMQKRSDKTKMAKGLKVPMSLLEPQLVEKIKGIINYLNCFFLVKDLYTCRLKFQG